MEYKVTVIVPVFKVEQYIERCVRSLFGQTLDAIEYIFVNDYSPDNSIDILYKVLVDYPHRKDHVRIFKHSKNEGLHVARRTGIEKANGEYIIHCDSDDWVELDMFRIMYEVAKGGDYDQVICDIELTSLKKLSHVSCKNKSELISKLITGQIIESLCCRLFKKSLYDNNILYPNYSTNEDFVLTMQLTYYSNSFYQIPRAFYNYYMRDDSLSHVCDNEGLIKSNFQYCKNLTLVEFFLNEKGLAEQYRKEIVNRKFFAKTMLLPIILDKHTCNYWLECFPEVNNICLLNQCVSLKTYTKHLLIKMRLYPLLISKYRIIKKIFKVH